MARGGKRPGSGGKPGVSHAHTTALKFDLLATLREKGFDPVAALVEIHLDAVKLYKEKLDPKKGSKGFGALGAMNVARESAKDLIEFVYPKRKAMELTGSEGADLFQSFTDLVKSIADEDGKH